MIFAIAFPIALAACSTAPLDSYQLAPVPALSVAQPRRAVLSVDEPSAPALVASNRIVIKRRGELAYLAGAQWSNILTQMVQRRLIEGFENARLFSAVAETGTASDVILSTDIRRFEIDGDKGEAVIEIAVRLVAARTGKTLHGTVVSSRAPAPAEGAAGITAALDAAFGEAAGKILLFAVKNT